MLASHRRYVVVALIVGALLACVGFPVAAFAGYNLYYFAVADSAATAMTTETPSPPAISTPTAAPVCGGPPTMFVLLVGSDSRANNYQAGLADSIRVVRADFVQPALTYIAFPRDLYVQIPGISEHGGITHGKLNQAYLYGNPAFGYYDGPGQGPELLAVTMALNFGVQVDHYAALNLQAFAGVIDALGGLDIDLPYTVDGRVTRSKDPDRYFSAGPQHLNGYRTMLLARMRPNGDLERNNVQNMILQALAAKMLSPAVLPKLPAMTETLYGSVQTDLTATDIRQLLCLGSVLNPGNISPLDFPESMFTGTRIQDPVLGYTFIWDADFSLIRQYIQQFNAGTWAAPLTGETAPDGVP
jgi:LCP family protein required for cell wall assembly